jgi:hypothetical protein
VPKQPAVGHPQWYCSKPHKRKHARMLRKQRDADEAAAEAEAEAFPHGVNPESRGVKWRKGR